MNLNDFRDITRSTAVYPQTVESFGLAYCALKLNGETQEMIDAWDRLLGSPRSDARIFQELTDHFRSEIGDVLWYVAALAWELTIAIDGPEPKYPYMTYTELIAGLQRESNRVAEFTGKYYRDTGLGPSEGAYLRIKETLNAFAHMIYAVLERYAWTVEDVLDDLNTKLEERKANGALHGNGESVADRRAGD